MEMEIWLYPSSQSETEQWSNNDGDWRWILSNSSCKLRKGTMMKWWWRWSFSNPSSQLRNGTKAGSDDAAAGSKVHSLDFDLCCSEMALIYVVLIDFDLCCSETAKVKIRTPMFLIYVFEKWFIIEKMPFFPREKLKTELIQRKSWKGEENALFASWVLYVQ